MFEVIQVVTTTGCKEDAERIAEHLVEQRLAACAQISGPIRSTYWWQGQVETSEEWICTAKTRRALYEQVERTIRKLHRYEEPEIVATDVIAGSEGYLRWVHRELSDSPDAGEDPR